jgi:hypothetical protein
MPKVKIVEKQIITVPYEGENGKFEARKQLWEYLKWQGQTAQTIYHNDKDIVAEVIVRTEEKVF